MISLTCLAMWKLSVMRATESLPGTGKTRPMR
jgi:hypothetical protein